MAESNHDDLADALAKMAESDFAPLKPDPKSPPPTAAPAAQPPVTRPAGPERAAPRAVRPASTRAPANRVAAPGAQPGVPAPPAPPAAQQPAPRPVTPIRTRPASPVTFSTPQSSGVPDAQASPPARKVRPAAPSIRPATVPVEPGQGEVAGDQSTALSGDVIDDDDSVIVPAPDPSVFEYRTKTAAQAREKVARAKNMQFFRTLIPILLTCGVLLLVFASLKFTSGADSMLSDLPIWIPAVLVVMAIVLLSLAVMLMLVVKNLTLQK